MRDDRTVGSCGSGRDRVQQRRQIENGTHTFLSSSTCSGLRISLVLVVHRCLKPSNRVPRVFTCFTAFVGGHGGKYMGRSFCGGILRRHGGGIGVGGESVDESPVMGGGLRSLRMKRPLMVKHIEGGAGSSLVRLGERGVPAQSNSPAVWSSATLD